jgi:hypothetical protein
MNFQNNPEEIRKFYKFIKPFSSSYITDKGEIAYLPKNEDDFVAYSLKTNHQHNMYAPFRGLQNKRNMQNVSFLNLFVVDIDNDPQGEEALKFENYCNHYKLSIAVKVFSGGGFHYYLPYKPTIINNANRQQYIQLSSNFCQHILNHNIKIDPKIFDLARLIRIWGTYNHARDQLCRVISFNSVTEAQIQQNTELINNINIPKKNINSADTLIHSCKLIKILNQHKIAEDGTQRNNVLLKNVAIFLRNLYGNEQGYDLGVRIAELQGKCEAEFRGWWEKIEIKQFSCGELVTWLKTYYPALLNKTCFKCHIENKNKINYVDGNETWFQLKKIAREKDTFLINKGLYVKGRIEPSTEAYKQEITLLEKFEILGKDREIVNPNYIRFFDEEPLKLKSEKATLTGTVCADFFIYSLVEDGVHYLLLSEQELDYGVHEVEGSLIKLNDKFLYGNYSTTKIKTKILLCHTATPLMKHINSLDELFTAITFTRQDLLNFLYSHKHEQKVYNEPEWLNNLLLSFLFSFKFPYPLHLLINGQQGCGKSSFQEAIAEKFDDAEIYSGSGSTIKGLIPSFGNKTPKIGALLSAQRLCCIDEFFGNVDEDNIDALRRMNELLEFRQRNISSGVGDVKAQMRAKLFGVTNPIEGLTFSETIQRTPETAIARIMVVNLGNDLTLWLKQKKQFSPLSSINFKLDNYTWLGIYDFLTSIKSNFDEDAVLKIVHELEHQVPDFMRPVYKTRYSNHHCFMLCDGLVKLRCMFNNDKSFIAKPQDYDEFKKLWEKIILNWNDDNKTLTQEQQRIMEHIPSDGIWDYNLEAFCKTRNLDYKFNIKALRELDKIKIDNGKITINVEEEVHFDDL